MVDLVETLKERAGVKQTYKTTEFQLLTATQTFSFMNHNFMNLVTKGNW